MLVASALCSSEADCLSPACREPDFYCGTQALAQEVAHYLGMDLSAIKIKRFADGEIYVQVLVCTLPVSCFHPVACLMLGVL